jgi:hypothetical protein
MTDVPIYVAVITAASGIIGAVASPFAIAYREGRQARRDRQEREVTAKRQACLDLLQAAGQLRTQVAGNYEYHGLEMRDRLEEVRKRAAEAELAATAVSLLARDKLAGPAGDLATAAVRLAENTATDTDLRNGSTASGSKPDFAPLDACVTAFRTAATREITA